MIITTIRGPIDEALLARTVGFEDRPSQYVVWVEWRHADELVRRDCWPLPKEGGDDVYTTLGVVPRSSVEQTVEIRDGVDDIAVAIVLRRGGEVVKRDVHVILKKVLDAAEAVAGGF